MKQVRKKIWIDNEKKEIERGVRWIQKVYIVEVKKCIKRKELQNEFCIFISQFPMKIFKNWKERFPLSFNVGRNKGYFGCIMFIAIFNFRLFTHAWGLCKLKICGMLEKLLKTLKQKMNYCLSSRLCNIKKNK